MHIKSSLIYKSIKTIITKEDQLLNYNHRYSTSSNKNV